MTISKPHKLLLFTKEECTPCTQAKRQLSNAIKERPELEHFVTVLQKEKQTALVEAYGLTMYPTLIVLDENADELARNVGSQNLTKTWWITALDAIHASRYQ